MAKIDDLRNKGRRGLGLPTIGKNDTLRDKAYNGLGLQAPSRASLDRLPANSNDSLATLPASSGWSHFGDTQSTIVSQTDVGGGVESSTQQLPIGVSSEILVVLGKLDSDQLIAVADLALKLSTERTT